MTLAQMGADVIRFDRTRGRARCRSLAGHSGWPAPVLGGLNKGKRSIAIDMKSERGKRAGDRDHHRAGRGCRDLPDQSAGARLDGSRDAVATPPRPDHGHMLGDRRGRPQVDYTVNPALGFPDATGPEGLEDPVAHALPAWDCIAGGLCRAEPSLAAERHRLKTGRGQGAEVSLKDVAAAMV
jgi:2-methylfumaryl-CoA isomerase